MASTDPAPRVDTSVILRDGRVLAYGEWGDESAELADRLRLPPCPIIGTSNGTGSYAMASRHPNVPWDGTELRLADLPPDGML